MSITTNINRIGNFTSSEIVSLTKEGRTKGTFGADAITYIAEKNLERIAGVSLSSDIDSKPLNWGKILEPRVFELLGMSYSYTSTETDVHPQIPYWSGSKDGMNNRGEKAVIDIKCPYTRKAFFQMVLPLHFGMTGIEAINAIRNGFTHEDISYPAYKEGNKYYWQLVSNAIINQVKHAELIVYMPYESELLEIKQENDGNPLAYFINYAKENELPFIPDGGKLSNLNVIRFEIPNEDKEFMTEQVLKAGKQLIKRTCVTVHETINSQPITIHDRL